jgi:transposase
MNFKSIGSSLAVEGATTREVFKAYVERILASPKLCPGQIVIMENLAAHKEERVKRLIEARGCWLLYLPPYSPDFTSIEEAFSKIKGILSLAEARIRETLVEAMSVALWVVTATDVQGFFSHCRYCLQG